MFRGVCCSLYEKEEMYPHDTYAAVGREWLNLYTNCNEKFVAT